MSPRAQDGRPQGDQAVVFRAYRQVVQHAGVQSLEVAGSGPDQNGVALVVCRARERSKEATGVFIRKVVTGWGESGQ